MQLQGALSFSCSNMKESCSKPVYRKLLERSEIAVIEKITALSLQLVSKTWESAVIVQTTSAFLSCSVPAALFKMTNWLHGGSDFIISSWFGAAVYSELWHKGIISLQNQMLKRKEKLHFLFFNNRIVIIFELLLTYLWYLLLLTFIRLRKSVYACLQCL